MWHSHKELCYTHKELCYTHKELCYKHHTQHWPERPVGQSLKGFKLDFNATHFTRSVQAILEHCTMLSLTQKLAQGVKLIHTHTHTHKHPTNPIDPHPHPHPHTCKHLWCHHASTSSSEHMTHARVLYTHISCMHIIYVWKTKHIDAHTFTYCEVRAMCKVYTCTRTLHTFHACLFIYVWETKHIDAHTFTVLWVWSTSYVVSVHMHMYSTHTCSPCIYYTSEKQNTLMHTHSRTVCYVLCAECTHARVLYTHFMHAYLYTFEKRNTLMHTHSRTECTHAHVLYTQTHTFRACIYYTSEKQNTMMHTHSRTVCYVPCAKCTQGMDAPDRHQRRSLLCRYYSPGFYCRCCWSGSCEEQRKGASLLSGLCSVHIEDVTGASLLSDLW